MIPPRMKLSETPDFNDGILTPSEGEIVRPVRTYPQHEVAFRDHCLNCGITCYLPMRRAWKVSSVTSNGREYNYSRETLRPMFASYVFVKTRAEHTRQLFETNMITRILPVSDEAGFLEELRTVRKVELVGYRQELEFHRDILEGDRFIILNGAWQGVTGYLVRRDKTFKWTVQIDFVNQQVTTTINPSRYKMQRV